MQSITSASKNLNEQTCFAFKERSLQQENDLKPTTAKEKKNSCLKKIISPFQKVGSTVISWVKTAITIALLSIGTLLFSIGVIFVGVGAYIFYRIARSSLIPNWSLSGPASFLKKKLASHLERLTNMTNEEKTQDAK